MCNSDGEAAREDEYLDLLLEQRVRGVLITAVDDDSPLLREPAGARRPVVLVDRPATGSRIGAASASTTSTAATSRSPT